MRRLEKMVRLRPGFNARGKGPKHLKLTEVEGIHNTIVSRCVVVWRAISGSANLRFVPTACHRALYEYFYLHSGGRRSDWRIRVCSL